MIEPILNRLRGTGDIIVTKYFKITGTMLYALYIGLLVGTLCYVSDVRFTALQEIVSIISMYLFDVSIVFSSFTHSMIGGVASAVLFLLGESFAFGKWVGYLVDYEDEHTPEYDSKVGKSFPYIHYLANYIVKETENYKLYCQVALTIRGFIWWTPLLILLGSIDLMSWYQVVASSIILAIGFPIACLVGRNWTFEYKTKHCFTKRGWGNQEIVYGAMQGIVLWYVVLGVMYGQ